MDCAGAVMNSGGDTNWIRRYTECEVAVYVGKAEAERLGMMTLRMTWKAETGATDGHRV